MNNLLSCSTAHDASWGNLLVQLSLQPDGHGNVLHVRAGLEEIPLEVGTAYKQHSLIAAITLTGRCKAV